MYRLFIAVDMPGRIKNELNKLYNGIPGARWVSDDQLHLTLRFIGEVDGSIFDDIKKLEPGSFLLINAERKIHKEVYWSPEQSQQDKKREADDVWVEKLTQELKTSVADRKSDV